MRAHAVARRVLLGAGRFAQENVVVDDAAFDAFVRRFQTRRGVIRTLLGGAAAVGVARPVLAGGPIPCDANGSVCDPAATFHCCTGYCKKHKGKFRCAPAGAPRGCKKKFDACLGKLYPCPDDPDGVCVRDNKGKPLCVSANAAGSGCMPCQSDADCADDAFPTARCIKHCKSCTLKSGGTACVIPAPVA